MKSRFHSILYQTWHICKSPLCNTPIFIMITAYIGFFMVTCVFAHPLSGNPAVEDARASFKKAALGDGSFYYNIMKRNPFFPEDAQPSIATKPIDSPKVPSRFVAEGNVATSVNGETKSVTKDKSTVVDPFRTLRVTGILGVQGVYRVFIEDIVAGKSYYMKKGDSNGHIKIVDIAPSYVMVKVGHLIRRMELVTERENTAEETMRETGRKG